MNTHIKSGYKPSPYDPRDHKFKGFSALKGKPLNPGGHWLPYAVQGELQDKNGSTNSCTSFGTLSSLSRLLNFKGIPTDFSKRYSAITSDTDEQSGNDPVKVVQTSRKVGLIPETELPYDDDLTPDDFYKPKPMAQKYLDDGKLLLLKWGIGYDDVFPSVENIKSALEYSPLGVAVKAWFPTTLPDDTTAYTFPADLPYNHWCSLIDYDDKFWFVFDSYEPFVKRIPLDQVFSKVLRYQISDPEELQMTLYDWLLQKLTVLVHLLTLQLQKGRSIVNNKNVRIKR